MLEVEVDRDVEIAVNTNVEVTAGNMNVAIIEDTNDIEVTVNRQEYVITGDEIYIPKRFEDAPTWMQNLITQVVDISIGAQIQDLNEISQSLESMIDAMEVAKNTYEMSIISSNDIDQRINTAVTTLNSSMQEADSTILEVAQTRVTPEEASAITIDVISAQLGSTTAGTIGATVSELQTAIANEEEARSTSIEVLTSSIEGAFDANATAMNYLNTYVGLDEVGASTGTGLSAYLEGSTGIVGEANSKVVNNVYVDALGNAKSKFEYGSTVSVNGVNHTAGFGLSNSTGTGIGSEFWINATKFKFTNNNKTGSKAPFTIDATGITPQVSFNGIVDFSNIVNPNGTGSNLLYNSAPKIGSETKGWYVWSNSGMTVNLSAGWNEWKPTGGASVAANIGGNPSIGSVYDVGQSSRFPVIAGKRYEASAYISAHRSNSYVFLVFYDAAGNYAGEASGNVINYAGANALANWGRSSVFATAPVNAATALLIIRSVVTSNDPYCFVTNAFAGVAEANQTTPSNWSEGTSAGATYTSELSNDAGFTTHSTINNNNDVFAQRLGYLSYADMVTAATNGQTIINGGYLRTNLIQAGAITANQINAYAIVGKHISGGTIDGTEINGTKINGAVINGARINGAVIKASYLDLDGELEVLTNYHISVAMFNSNPSLYEDAVFISADNEYRIPSLSVLNWNGGSASAAGANGPFGPRGTFSASLNTGLHAYNVANAGVNTKAVKIRPIMSISAINMKTGVYGINDLSAPYSIAHCIMYFGNIQLCKLRLWTYPQESGGRIRFTIERYGQSSLNGVDGQLDGTTFTILGISFSVSSYVSDYPPDWNGNSTGRDVETTITVTKAIGELGFDFLSGSIRFDVYAEKPFFSDCRASVSSTGISINNMV